MDSEEMESRGTGEPFEKRKRKRIAYKPRVENILEDPLELKPNKCSVKARRVFVEEENITIELWFDKHYLDRNQHGDEFGKRDGIDNDTVEDLVRRSLKHMIAYSTLVKGFTFLNRNILPNERPIRLVLQEQADCGLLNVVIEAHFVEVDKYEITVKTAMCKDNYQLSDNQYAIELDGDGSILRKSDVKTVRDVSNI